MTTTRQPHPWEELKGRERPLVYFEKFFADKPMDVAITILKQYAHEAKQVDIFNFLSDSDRLNDQTFHNKYISQDAPYQINIAKENLNTMKDHLMKTANEDLNQDGRKKILARITPLVTNNLENAYKVLTDTHSTQNAKQQFLDELRLGNSLGENFNKKRMLLEMVIQKALEENKSQETIMAIVRLGERLPKQLLPLPLEPSEDQAKRMRLVNELSKDFFDHTVEMSLQSWQPKIAVEIINFAMEKLKGDTKKTFVDLTKAKLSTDFMFETIRNNAVDLRRTIETLKNVLPSTPSQLEKLDEKLKLVIAADIIAGDKVMTRAERLSMENIVKKMSMLSKGQDELKDILSHYLKQSMEPLERRLRSMDANKYSLTNLPTLNQNETAAQHAENYAKLRSALSSIKRNLNDPSKLKTEDYVKMIQEIEEKSKGVIEADKVKETNKIQSQTKLMSSEKVKEKAQQVKEKASRVKEKVSEKISSLNPFRRR